jgi:Ca2+-binding RTX toxin-like protein
MRKREPVLSVAALLGMLTLAAAPGHAQGTNPCDPANCPVGCNQIVGTAGDDKLSGTSGCDCIYGLGGNDCIYGLMGDDILCGGDGIDFLRGDGGTDRAYGEAGDDQLCTELQDGGTGTDGCQNLAGFSWVNCELLRADCPTCEQP